ncbi:Myb-like DNA-binding domain containing protein [Tritrichomonas foetus]|uniref:Myb-like DNA-binding domain containing protein n=1 Tax=Tritrichomonas foetus TaxID=1144522 RepID=A0A1J4KEN3_9EUKA|nr:Myb-like DNA-binding domain containing protein [Tritrichomonas foetus]|eukprot:OHT07853.1 Myb-like DNA-binding domain containing protein [Tritrichomonas foetus]
MQKISRSGLQAILELATNDLERSQQLPSPEVHDQLVNTISEFLQQKISFNDACQVFNNACSSTTIINRMRDIIEVGDNPLPSSDNEEDHKKSRSWSGVEDNRLLAGILRNGLENWATVATFVGNNRTRAQCTQRWARGLNPRISKETWSADEEARLLSYVRQFGDKAWTKISKLLGTRSDAQCRYHYIQMTKSIPPMTMISLRPRLSVPTLPTNPMMMMAPAMAVQLPNQMEARRSSMIQFGRQNLQVQPGNILRQSNPNMNGPPPPATLQMMPPLAGNQNGQGMPLQFTQQIPVSIPQQNMTPNLTQNMSQPKRNDKHEGNKNAEMNDKPNNSNEIMGFLQRFNK